VAVELSGGLLSHRICGSEAGGLTEGTGPAGFLQDLVALGLVVPQQNLKAGGFPEGTSGLGASGLPGRSSGSGAGGVPDGTC
jgi:hypothetical protein